MRMWSRKSVFWVSSLRLRIMSTITRSPMDDLPAVRLKEYSTSAQCSPWWRPRQLARIEPMFLRCMN